MGLFKLLIIALAAWLIWRGVKAYQARRLAQQSIQTQTTPTQGGKMKVCARCGVHYPPETGVVENGLDYCSTACADQA